MKIFAGHDGGSGCAYYRIIQPLTELGRHDSYDVTLASMNANPPNRGISAAQMAGHDVIVMHRPNKHDGLSTWRRMRTPATRLVYDTDDDVFSIEPVNWAAYNTFMNDVTRDAMAHAAEVADLVTVSTQPLADVMAEFNPNVAVLPNHIPALVLDLPRTERARPVVGWAGGASHALDIQIVARPLRRFLDRYPGWDAVMVGTDYRPTIRHPRVGFVPWVQITDDPAAYYRVIDFDIALAPLGNGKFNRSKSAIRALEAAARGIPVVASDVAPYRDFVVHGVTGFVVRRDHEWLQYLSELAADEGLRAQMGAKAREVARGYVIEDGWKLWAEAYEGLYQR